MAFTNQREIDLELRVRALEDFLAEQGFQQAIPRPDIPTPPQKGRREDRKTEARRYKL